ADRHVRRSCWEQRGHRGHRGTQAEEKRRDRALPAARCQPPVACCQLAAACCQPLATMTPMEAWLRGPVEGVPPLLQPVAHMILHAVDDVGVALEGLSPEQIWASPGGAASVAYHV